MTQSFFIFLSLFIWVYQANAQTGVEVPELAGVDAAVEALMDKWEVPGGSVAITYQGRLVYARGFGMASVEEGISVTPSHVFRIASLSKSITGIAIAKLIEDGLLTKNDLVFGSSGILKDAPYDVLNDSRMESITVGHLLYHTSGFGRMASNRDPVFADIFVANQTGWSLPHDPATKIEYYLKNESLARDPGTAYEYSNLGFLILGRVIEAITRMSYVEYCQMALFDPNGIETIRMGQSLLEDTYDNEVRYYGFPGVGNGTSIYGTGESVPWHYGGINVESFDSHGGWTASAVDLMRLLVSVDGFSSKPDILSPSAIQTMTTPSSLRNYAFGFNVNNANNWWHLGSIAGTSAEWVRASNGLNWALLFNTRPQPSQNNAFLGEIDALIWSVLPSIQSWPAHDLFEEDGNVTTANEAISAVTEYRLHGNYPNPFNPRTTISYDLANTSQVSLKVYNALGREIATLVDGIYSQGTYKAVWDGRNNEGEVVPSGVYIYQLTYGSGLRQSRVMVLLK